MSYYYGLRGWLECSPEHFSTITRVLQEAQREVNENNTASIWQKSYMRGWCWNDEQPGYVFYGSDTTETGLALHEKTLLRMTKLESGLRGFFHAQGEDTEENYTFRIEKDTLTRSASAPMFESDYDEQPATTTGSHPGRGHR
ncbi:hypothetical protein WMF38_31660 [Sorangium sp. So ce118]